MEATARAKTEKSTRSSVECEGFATVFFDCRDVVHHEFLSQDRTVNKKYYLQVMRKQSTGNARICERTKIGFCTVITPLLIRRYLWTNFWPKTTQSRCHSHCVPQIWPSVTFLVWHFLFPKLKKPMKGQRYTTLEDIKTASKEELNKITKMIFEVLRELEKTWAEVHNI